MNTPIQDLISPGLIERLDQLRDVLPPADDNVDEWGNDADCCKPVSAETIQKLRADLEKRWPDLPNDKPTAINERLKINQAKQRIDDAGNKYIIIKPL